MMHRRQRAAVAILGSWAFVMVAISIGAITHRIDIGALALAGQVAFLTGGVTGLWVQRGRDDGL